MHAVQQAIKQKGRVKEGCTGNAKEHYMQTSTSYFKGLHAIVKSVKNDNA